MTLEDRYVTPTPEGVSLDTVLAGLGSRFAAFALDFLLQVVLFAVIAVVVVIAFHRGGETSGLIATGILALVFLLDFIGYFIICEMLWSGRSVGKRAAGTRVVRVGGAPVGFWSSLLRNITRLIDMLPAPFYLVGSVLILSTSKNQRLGDLLGNTVVIRERQAAMTLQRGTSFSEPGQWMAPGAFAPPWAPGYAGSPALPPELAHWDVSAVNDGELTLVRTFLANRWGYTPEARGALALQLADRLWPLVAGPVTAPHPEQFLEAILLVKSVRG
ncbi:MAG TPA: RDD family protein [Acidimicrobiales bacterium]|nr:RDD family protein [Acidimicrobiales bacterium]